MTDLYKRQPRADANPVRIHGTEIRVARKLLKWSRVKLARRAGVPLWLLVTFELHRGRVDRDSLSRLRRVLEYAGIDFTGPPVFPGHVACMSTRPGVNVTFSGPPQRSRGRR